MYKCIDCFSNSRFLVVLCDPGRICFNKCQLLHYKPCSPLGVLNALPDLSAAEQASTLSAYWAASNQWYSLDILGMFASIFVTDLPSLPMLGHAFA